MRTLGTVLAALAALVWSGLVWGAYGVGAVSSDLIARNAGWHDLPAEAIGWVSLLDRFLRDYGMGLAAAIWAIGLLAILAVRAIYNSFLGLAPTQRAAAPGEANPSGDRPAAGPRPDDPPADPMQWGRSVRNAGNVH